MDGMSLFSAMSGIEDRDIWETGELLTGRDALPLRRARLKRTALIAAAAAVLALAACTVTVLTLEKRLVPPEDLAPAADSSPAQSPAATGGGYLSPYGGADRPEAQAAVEWKLYRDSRDWGEDEWFPEEEDLRFYKFTYAAFDPEAIDKLFEIRDKYGLKLHSGSTWAMDAEDLYQVSGTGPFLLADESSLVPRDVYEDGSFTAEGGLTMSDGTEISFRIDRNGPGVLPPYGTRYISDPSLYEQWQYTAACGEQVLIAFYPHEEFPDALVFCEKDGWSAQVQVYLPAGAGRETVQAAADCFDFGALCSGGEDVPGYIGRGPTVSANGTSLTVEALLDTPEYQAAAEFGEQYAAWMGDQIYFYGYYGSWPSGDETLDTLADRLTEQYALTPAESSECFLGGTFYPPEAVAPTWGIRLDWTEDASSAPATAEEIYRRMGCEPFLTDDEPFSGILYDNGCFFTTFTAGGREAGLHYLKKGCLYTAIGDHFDPSPALNPTAEAWTYDAAWGGSVTITMDGSDAYLLYETPEAYVLLDYSTGDARLLEALADSVDFSKLP